VILRVTPASYSSPVGLPGQPRAHRPHRMRCPDWRIVDKRRCAEFDMYREVTTFVKQQSARATAQGDDPRARAVGFPSLWR
jgi:hypothetical protein